MLSLRLSPKLLFLGIFVFFLGRLLLAQSEWQSFSNARLLDTDFADGDSFAVEIDRNGKTEVHIVRLYFVDTPETISGSESDRRRVLEQMRYFGIPDPDVVIDIGKQASSFTKAILSEPFTLHTAFASALGRSKKPRIYCMITTSDNRDLATELVKSGLARVKGVGRATHDGVPSAEFVELLSDLESSAMLTRTGVWAHSDAGKLSALRAEEREESRKLDRVFEGNANQPVNLNTATAAELERLPGVGPAIAQRIIDARPFVSVDDLQRVSGISANALADWDSLITVD